MYLKRCEMVGFKTFADKVEMEFGPGITAIVGPNGSGKSNITDALRFCLGEASSRTLRGNRMEEMIFAGSGTRPPAGMAEATIVFDNQDGYFPLEFSEVSFTRKLFRGGENQYFINKSQARLKDIQDLLAGTGLGHGSICMLGAREMSMVLSPDSQDRKLILEEASGVLKYKMRKREATRKLDQVKDNITRLNDILREVKAGLATAEQQLERYRRFKRAEERLRRLEVGLAGREMEELRAYLDDVLSRGEDASRLAHETGLRLASLEETVTSRREEAGRLESALEQAQDERRTVSIELERARKEIALCDEREMNMERERERILGRLARIREQEAELGAQQDTARTELDCASAEVATWDARVTTQEHQLETLESQSVERSAPYQQALAEQSAVGRELAGLRARQEGTADRARRAFERAEALEQKALRAQEEQSRHGSHQQEKAEEIDTLRASLADLDAQVAEIRARRTQLEQAAQAAAREYEKIEDAYHQRSSRLGALMEIEDDYQGFSEGVRFLLRGPHRPDGVIGTVAECITTERNHARAIEAALGGHAQDVLVEGKFHAKACIHLLKRERAGKVTFWPLDLERPDQRRPDVLHSAGVVGWAPELVQYDARYDGVVKALLGRTVIMENLDVATELYESLVRRRGFIPMLVTLDGDVLAPGGSMSGGTHKNTRVGPVQRRAELQALEKEVEGLRDRFIRVKDARRRHDQELMDLRSRSDELRAEVQKAQQRLVELDRAASIAQSRAESVGSEVERLQAEAEASLQEAAEAQEEQGRIIQALEGLAERERLVTERLAEMSQEREAQAAERAELQRALDELKEKRAVAMRQEAEVAQRVKFISERRAELAREGRELDEEASGQGGLAGSLQRARERASAEASRCLELEQAAARRCEELAAAKGEVGGDLERLEAELSELSKRHTRYRDDLHACEVERAHHQATYEEHRLRMEELEVTQAELRAAAADIDDPEKCAAEANRTRNYLKNFGNVNLGAQDDHDQLKQRHDQMSEQVRDLEEASASLLGVIQEMDEASVRQFADTFGRVKGHFTDLFTSLFNGGHAELILTQPQNLLDTGVDIVAQPPGKRLQNLSLFSSGEKALTAIAFLLAILRARPSPFVVLDELDAPLDDTNVERVARKFEEFSVDTQFITITHNRKTMEFARVLYGVTMSDPGVSRLVAVSLEEAKRDLHPPQPGMEAAGARSRSG